MTDGYTTRKLVRQEWKPLGGRRIEVFVVATTGASMPGMEWTDNLPGNSEVVNEVLGYVEWPSGTWSGRFEDEEEFRDYVEGEAQYVQWVDREGPESVPEEPEQEETNGSGDEEESEQTELSPVSEDSEATGDDPTVLPGDNGLVAVCEDCGFSHDEIACWDDDAVITEDGVVEYDPEDEPYTLPDDADETDVREEVVYEGYISGIKPYGFFVNLTESRPDDTEVSGLVHDSKLGLQSPQDFYVGETVSVEVENWDGGLSFYLDGSESGLDKLFVTREDDS